MSGPQTVLEISTADRTKQGLDSASKQYDGWLKKMAKAAGAGSIGGLFTSTIMGSLSNLGTVGGGGAAGLTKLFSGALGGALAGGAVAGPVGALVGGAAGATSAAVHELVSGLSELTDKFEKAKHNAEALGLSTNAFQGLEYAAIRSEASSESFVKSFGHLNRTIDEAKGKEGPARALFNQLGVSLDDLQNKSPTEVFLKLADSIKGVEDPTQRSVDAFMIFGKSGQELLPMMMKGSEGINALRDKAEELSIAMSDEQLDALDAYKESMEDLEDHWESAKVKILTAAVPAIKKLIDALTWLVQVLTKSDFSVRDWVARQIAKAGEAVGLLPEGTSKALEEDQAFERKQQQQKEEAEKQARAAKRRDRDKAPKPNEESVSGNIEAINKAQQIIGKTAAELFEEERQALAKARQFGAITDDQFSQGIFNAGNKLIQAMGRVSNTAPLMLEGSKEATETIIRSMNGPVNDPQAAVRIALDTANRLHQQQVDIGKQMAGALDAIKNRQPAEGMTL